MERVKASRGYDLVSGDTHLELSEALVEQWAEHVDPEFREFMPRIVQLDSGGDGWQLWGNPAPMPLGLNFVAGIPRDEIQLEGHSYARARAGGRTAEAHLRDEMDVDGVDAQLLFPAAGVRYGHLPAEAQIALAQGYNDWLSQTYCAADYERLFGLAVVPNTGVDDAIAELERVAAMPGMRGVTLWQWPNGSGHPEPDDDRFWEATQRLGVQVACHVSFGAGAAEDQRRPPSTSMTTPVNAQIARGGGPAYTPTQLITEGVLDRFPDLRFYLAETFAGWVPYWMDQADDMFRRNRYWSGLDIEHEPSWYIPRHFVWNFPWDLVAIRHRHEIGVENLTWGDDFPHSNCDWPNSRKLVERHFEGVPEDEARKIKSENLLNLFGVDHA